MNLRIYLSKRWISDESTCSWSLLTNHLGKNGLQIEDGICALVDMPKADSVTVILSADSVLVTSAQLPAVSKSKLRPLLPFAVEDKLISNSSNEHIVPSAQLENGETILYVLNDSWFTAFLDCCSKNNIAVANVVPEVSLLSAKTGELNVAWSGSEGMLADSNGMGGYLDVCDHNNAPQSLLMRLSVAPYSLVKLFQYRQRSSVPEWNLSIPIVMEETIFDWRSVAIPSTAPNLLYGKHAAPTRLKEVLPFVRPLLMTLAILIFAEILFSNLEWFWLSQERNMLRQEITKTFKDTLGAEAELVNAPLQMQRKLASLRHMAGKQDETDMLPLMDAFARAGMKAPSIAISSAHYEIGKLEISLSLTSSEDLSTLQSTLRMMGLNFQAKEINRVGERLHIQATLTAGVVK